MTDVRIIYFTNFSAYLFPFSNFSACFSNFSRDLFYFFAWYSEVYYAKFSLIMQILNTLVHSMHQYVQWYSKGATYIFLFILYCILWYYFLRKVFKCYLNVSKFKYIDTQYSHRIDHIHELLTCKLDSFLSSWVLISLIFHSIYV